MPENENENTPPSQRDLVTLASSLLRRSQIGAALGQTFEGDRDLYTVLGYNRTPEYDDYLAHYQRQDVAKRVIDLPAGDTWKKPPALLDGNVRGDGEGKKTPFLEAWDELVKAHKVFHYLSRLDRLAGLGRYSLLVIGLSGGKELASEVKKSKDIKLIYLKPYGEGAVKKIDLEQDTANERFGLPKTYKVAVGRGKDGGGTRSAGGQETPIHHSRVLHVVQDPLESDVYGQPRLEAVLNRLEDLQKIVGGGSEAIWKLMRKGMVLSAKDGYQLPTDGTPEFETMMDEIEEFDHGLRRILRLAGIEAKELGGEVIDPTGMFQSLIALIAAASDIPQRILIGSERGELASTQDKVVWSNHIAGRQMTFAEPMILRPFIDWCIQYGVLQEPANGEYSISWPALYELSDLEKAELTEKKANAAEKLANIPDLVPPGEARVEFLYLPAESSYPTADDLIDEEDEELAPFEEDDEDNE